MEERLFTVDFAELKSRMTREQVNKADEKFDEMLQNVKKDLPYQLNTLVYDVCDAFTNFGLEPTGNMLKQFNKVADEFNISHYILARWLLEKMIDMNVKDNSTGKMASNHLKALMRRGRKQLFDELTKSKIEGYIGLKDLDNILDRYESMIEDIRYIAYSIIYHRGIRK